MLFLCLFLSLHFWSANDLSSQGEQGQRGSLHSWAFLVICGDGVEVSESFYLCPEQGVMKSMMMLEHGGNWFSGGICTCLINNVVGPWSTTPSPDITVEWSPEQTGSASLPSLMPPHPRGLESWALSLVTWSQLFVCKLVEYFQFPGTAHVWSVLSQTYMTNGLF